MKVIDLLNNIANNENVPEVIKYRGAIYEYIESEGDYLHRTSWLFFNKIFQHGGTAAKLNYEVIVYKSKKEDISDEQKS